MLLVLPVVYFFMPQVFASCPPFQSETVRAVCWLGERAVDCMKDPVPARTLARFFCMPGHQLAQLNMPPARFQSRCGADGKWSMQPFSCEPVTCPPLQLRTVVAECTLEGNQVPCEDQRVSPGTVASFRCKPGHKIKFGYSRDPNFQSQCGADGMWSEGPFRCEPERKAAPPASVAPPAPASAAAPAPVTCPPLQSKTVLVKCRFQGQPVDCTAQSVPSGTTARFSCKPLHQFLFGYLPASSPESRCGADGQWTVQPFRCEPICGQPTGKGISFIRDGNVTASAADFPWHVIIYDLTKDLQQICGGTLISPKYFVSAAHCFHDGKRTSPATIYRAGFGRIKRNVNEQEPNEQYRELEKIYIKDYGGSKELYSNDISLVELRDEVDITSSTMPVCVDWGLELPNLRHGERGAVVGFGDTADRAHDTLRFALLPFIKSAECKRHVSDSLAVYNKLPDKFCIGFVNSTTVAKGDSGGGIAFPNEERTWYLRGVVSLGSSQESTYSFFTNITGFVPWMSSLIQLGEVSGRRCGVDVNQASIVSGATAGQFDFPWEVDLYYKQTSNNDFERLTTGALIGPNLIITRAKSVTSTGQPIDLAEYPSTWLRVTPRRAARMTNLEKATNVSEVVRGFFPSDVLAASGLFYNILLLELKQPVHLMPVCLDWTGGALLKKERLGTALSDYEPGNSTVWTRLPILNTTTCKQLSSVQPGSHHVCTVQEGMKQFRPHNSLYVFAGSTWFLRGVGSDSVSTPDGTVTAYTDMSDRGVRQWLSKTSDKIGKPTCGNVNLCEPLSAGLSLRGHMPWTVAVVVGTGNGNRTESGILIQPNAVVADSAALVNLTGWNGDGAVPTVPPDSITVLWTSADGSVKKSQVVRVYVRESAEVAKDGRPLLDVALLELRPDQAVLSTPVCLDLNGNVLQQLATGQLGLVEAWSSWGPTNHSLVSVPFMGPAECSSQLRSSNRSREANEFCTSASPGVLDSTVLGGGYLVSSGSQWYLQGLYTGFARLRHRTVGLASDLRDDALKEWMREKLKKIKTVNLKSPDDSGPKNCVGGRPTATECGAFNSKDELQDENDFLYKTSRNRMEWNVQVHVYRNNPVWEVRGGVLIRTSMVVTSALHMFARKSNESSGLGEPIRTSNVLVKYITADGRGPFSVEVRRIHLKERCVRCGPRAEAPPELHYDVALLELSSPVTLMPVCVPKPGWVTAPLNTLTEGLVEVWDDAYSSQRTLVPSLFRTLGACRIQPPEDFLNAEFCTEPTSGATTQKMPAVGAAFSVLAQGGAGGWFLRGIQGTPWNSTEGSTVPIFYNVDEPGLREWLNEKMQVRTADGSTVPLPEPKLQPLVLSEPTQSSKCGQTNLPLFSLAYNHTLPGPLPWSVAIYIGDNDKTFISGVLIRDDIVITDAHMLVVPGSAWNDSVVVRTVDAAEVRVMWVSHTGRRYGSQVVAVHARERDRGAYQSPRTFDVALLRLKKPFPNSGAACWDQNLPTLERYQLGVTDAWDVSILDFQSDVLATPYVNVINDHCIFKTTVIPRLKMSSERYCTGPVRVGVKPGAGFLIRKGDSWFVHGILSSIVASGDDRWVITDLGEEGVSSWIHEKLAVESVDPPMHSAELPAEPVRPNECGKTTVPLSSLTENGTLADHMPWTVVVYRKDLNGTIKMSPGVLVRNDAVLTDASRLVEPLVEGSDQLRAVDPKSVFVVWFTPSGRRRRSTVLRIIVGGQSYRLGSSNITFNLALLRLGSPFRNSSVACLDLENTLPGIVEGNIGVMETWNGDPFWFANDIVATNFTSNADCGLAQQPANVASNMVCTKGTRALEGTLKRRKGNKVFLDVKPGSGIFERNGDAWFVRGIVAFSGGSAEDRLAVVALADTSTRAWLREKLAVSGADAAPS